MDNIILAESETDIKRCFPVMLELRSNLKNEGEFFRKVVELQKIADYKLIFFEDNGEVKSAAGIRISVCLAWEYYKSPFCIKVKIIKDQP